MHFFPNSENNSFYPEPRFYSLWVIITVILLPPMWPLSIPALFFSEEAKKLCKNGYGHLAFSYSIKIKRLIISSWAIAIIVLVTSLALFFISHLSLI